MRFPQVPVGRRFIFQDKRYTKTGPLTASEEGTGKSRLIMKSAEVTPLEETDRSRPQMPERSYSQAEVEALLTEYRAGLRESLSQAAEVKGDLTAEEIVSIIDAQPLPARRD